jgi:hypothetical protein
MGATILQQQNGPLNGYVLGFSQSVPPGFEFIRDFDVPRDNQIIMQS